jgi:ketosteroid isomerase-like protein
MAIAADDPATREADALLDRLFAAITAGDIDAVAAIYHDEIRVWHNVTDRAVDKRTGLAILRWYVKTVSARHYEVVERRHWPGGVMQRHVLHGQAGETAIRAPACISFELRDGQIVTIHEYVDSGAIAAMMPSG